MKARQLTKRDNKIIFYYDHPADTVIKTDFSQKMSWAGFVSKKEDFFEFGLSLTNQKTAKRFRKQGQEKLHRIYSLTARKRFDRV